MIIVVHPNKLLSEIASDFNKFFPFLKIEFFKNPHAWLETSKTEDAISPNQKISDATKINKDVFIEIHYWQKTGTIEQVFKNKLDLSIQIFRRQGEHWIQTNGTDILTLEEQNQIGKMFSEDSYHLYNNNFFLEKKL